MRSLLGTLVTFVVVVGAAGCGGAEPSGAASPQAASARDDGSDRPREASPLTPSALADVGGRLWTFAREAPRARLTLESMPAGEESHRPRCPGPSVLCAEPGASRDAILTLGGIFGEHAVNGRCELRGVTRLEGTHVCGGSLEGQRVIIGRSDEVATVQLAGNAFFPWQALESDRFRLTPADPIAAGYAEARQSGNRSSETAHLATLTEPAESAAEDQGFGTPEAARAAVSEVGVDPSTLTVAGARRLARSFMDARISALRLRPERRDELAREIVEEVLHGGPSTQLDPEQRVAPAEAERGPARLRWIRTDPGSGPRPTRDGVVKLVWLAWDAEGRLLSERRGPLPVASLREPWADLVVAMHAGETRRVWLPEGGSASVVSLTLEEADVAVAPPAPPLSPPAGARASRLGLQMQLITQVDAGARPTADQELQVSFAAWNAAGRLLRWSPDEHWNSYAFTGDDSLEVAATQALRVGERARFWVPSSVLRASREPRSEIAVFEVELLAVH